jgi:hypothetical protein
MGSSRYLKRSNAFARLSAAMIDHLALTCRKGGQLARGRCDAVATGRILGRIAHVYRFYLSSEHLPIGGLLTQHHPAESLLSREPPVKTIQLVGDIDQEHRLHAEVPRELPPGRVRLIVLLPEEDEAGREWAQGVSREWAEDLADARQDIYTLEDGEPVDASR